MLRFWVVFQGRLIGKYNQFILDDLIKATNGKASLHTIVLVT